MKPFGVKVLCIEPGFFKTSVTDSTILSESVKKLWGRLPPDVRQDYGADYLPNGRFSTCRGRRLSIRRVCVHRALRFPRSFTYAHCEAEQHERRGSDEGGELHGARRVRAAAPHPLLARLGRQAVLAAHVVHAQLHFRLHHAERGHSCCQASGIIRAAFCFFVCALHLT